MIAITLETLCQTMMVLFGSSQKKVGIQNPVFRKEAMPDIEKELECW